MAYILSNETNRLFNLITLPEEWKDKPEEIQKILGRLAEETKVIKNQLFKMVKGKYILFFKPSERVDIIEILIM